MIIPLPEYFSRFFIVEQIKNERILFMTTLLVLDEVSFIMKILELPLCLKRIFNKLLLTTKKAVHLIEPYSPIFQSFLSQCIYGQPYTFLFCEIVEIVKFWTNIILR